MNLLIPPPLKKGDTIAVLAPSSSGAMVSQECRDHAINILEQLGLKAVLTPGSTYDDALTRDEQQQLQLAELHAAFADPACHGILTIIGGYHSNQLLPHLDYNLIRRHPKFFCGYSDITALQQAMLTQANLVTFSGPHFSTFGMKLGLDYTLAEFATAAFQNYPHDVQPGAAWSDERWFLDQVNRNFHPNPGHITLRVGMGYGRLVGGNLSTLSLLNGTSYGDFEFLGDLVLFLEDDAESNADIFERQLSALTQQPWFTQVTAVVFGRFQSASNINAADLDRYAGMCQRHRQLPVLAGLDFGHTTPHTCLPIGGYMRVAAKPTQSKVTVALNECPTS